VNPQQDAALRLDARGWVVVPAHRPKPGATKASHPAEQGKIPLGKEWEKSARMQPHEIEEAWSGQKPWNIALLTGAPSGVFVLDVDPGSGGVESMKPLIAEHGPLPQTFTVRTGRGGWHFYFLMPGDFDVRNSQDKVGKGIDIRGTGGFVVAPASTTCFGPYSVTNPSPAAPAPAWLLEIVKPKVSAGPIGVQHDVDALKPEAMTPYEEKIIHGEIARLAALPRPWQPGAGWDSTIFEVAATLTEVANSSWAALNHREVEWILSEYAPHDDQWDEREAKLASARRKVGSTPRTHGPTGGNSASEVDRLLFTNATPASSATSDLGPPSPGSRRAIAHDGQVDVSNHALAASWLMDEVGVGRLSGVFYRKGELVYTPRIGEEGYVEPRNAVAEGAASITIMTEHDLQARIQHRYQVTKLTKDAEATKRAKAIDPHAEDIWKDTPAIFPLESAKVIANAADDAPNLRTLHGVVHAPTFRPDGSLITRPGYDEATGLLFLPTGGQPDAVPEVPSTSDVDMAVKMLDYMLQDFQFETNHDRASYIGLMLTPLLRTLVPAPYKLGVIEAHQPGSGKSFLARALASVHGGVMHSEMPPSEEEFQKVIGSILDTQTSPVVVFDNVTGLLRSSTLAGLLTSPTFQGRRLGSSTVIEADNDRLWVITGNNAALSGDLGRRNVRVRIDPGVPNPEARTGFAIDDFEAWVREHRGELLWALLVLARNWTVKGMPLFEAPTGDSYGRWVSTLRSITRLASIPGTFDDPSTRADAVDPEADDFTRFLEVVIDTMGDRSWTTKDLLGLVAHPSLQVDDPSKPIPFDALPGDLTKNRFVTEPSLLATTLGRWLTNRKGRWFSNLCVKQVGARTKHGIYWKVERYGV
jgi:hypothetical protein